MQKVSIVIPAYNEEKRIGKTLETYLSYFEKIRKEEDLDYEILVVINNTTDSTEDVVKGYAKKNKRLRYLNLKPGGKGFAVIEGFKDALSRDNELIGFVDADMSTYPEDFQDLIKNIGSSDAAIASRYLPGSIIKPKPTLQRLVAKRVFNYLVRSLMLLPIRDTQCGAKVFKRKALEKTIPSLTMSLWAFDVDLLYSLRKKGFTIREIKTRWTHRNYEVINFWSAGPSMALGVLRLRILNSPFRDLIGVYDVFFRFSWKLRVTK